MRLKNLLGALLLAATGVAQATIVVNTDWSSGFSAGNGIIPDANFIGWADTRSFTGLDNSGINSVTVRLDIAGGYNGDLYGYLVHQDLSGGNAGFAVLLNRVGTGSGSEPLFTFGFDTAGFNNITLSDGAMLNIHDVVNPTGGTYAPDGGSLASFNDFNANGTWTLFLADLSGGEQAIVNSWGMEISVIPEPVTWTIILFAVAFAIIRARPFRRLLRA